MERILSLLLLCAVARAEKQCFAKMSEPNVKKFVEAQKGQVASAFGKAIKNVQVDTPDGSKVPIQQVLENTGRCQMDCLGSQFETALLQLLGSMEIIGDTESKDWNKKFNDRAIASFSGALKACYPTMPPKAIKDLTAPIWAQEEKDAEKEGKSPLLRLLSEDDSSQAGAGQLPSDMARRLLGTPCVGLKSMAAHKDKLLAGMTKMAGDLQKAVEKVPAALEFMKSSYDCQTTCMGSAFSETFKTLVDTGALMDSTRMGQVNDAITGVIRMCYPGIKHDIAKIMVTTASQISDEEAKTVQRLYENVRMTEEPAATVSVGALSGVALVTFVIGAAVGVNRLRKRKEVREQPYLEEDIE